MTQQAQELLDSALSLAEDDQMQLVAALLSAVDERGWRPFDDAALAEIQRRSAEYDAGGVTPIPWEEVKERARREVGRHG